MILTDANILMYAAGSAHDYKAPSIAFLNKVADGEIEATTDTEVLQEILHRYRCLKRWAEGQKVYDLARQLFPEVLAVTAEVMDEARQILATNAMLSARDAVHAAVVSTYKLKGICTFDIDFDHIEGCRRIDPARPV